MTIQKLSDAPFVGRLGRDSNIEFLEQDGELLCRSARGSLIFAQTVLFLFASALSLGVWHGLSNPATPRNPRFATVFMAFFTLVGWLIFFRNLLGPPHLVVNGATGDLLLFKRRTREPWKRIAASEISHFSIEKQPYFDKTRAFENAVLFIFTKDGERRALCGSPDQAQVKSLADQLAQGTQSKVI